MVIQKISVSSQYSQTFVQWTSVMQGNKCVQIFKVAIYLLMTAAKTEPKRTGSRT